MGKHEDTGDDTKVLLALFILAEDEKSLDFYRTIDFVKYVHSNSYQVCVIQPNSNRGEESFAFDLEYSLLQKLFMNEF